MSIFVQPTFDDVNVVTGRLDLIHNIVFYSVIFITKTTCI